MQENDMGMELMTVRETSGEQEIPAEKKETGGTIVPIVPEMTDSEGLKKKYGQIFKIAVTVDEDDENMGRVLEFIFRKPTAASFNRYLKTANKNMSASTVVFVQDNIIDEQRETFKKETEVYPGLALNIGQKLLSTIGLGDNVNFRRL